MLGGVSAADYKKRLGDFLGDDARKMREAAMENAWELILDNIPKGRVLEEKMEGGKRERGLVGETDNDRCVEALRIQGRSAKEESEKTETEMEGRKKKIVRRDEISNIQPEGRQLKDQYLTGNREETGGVVLSEG